MTVNRILLFLLTMMFVDALTNPVNAQCTAPSFGITGSTCSSSPINFSNSTNGSHEFLWDFCIGDFESPDYDTTLQLLAPGTFTTTAGAAFAEDASGAHCFICNRDGQSIYRLDYGNGISNSPTALVDLGGLTVANSGPNDICFIQENGIWYAFVVNVFGSNVGLLQFGNGLDQLPTTAQIVVSSGLGLPRGIKCVKDVTGAFHLFIANNSANTISHFNFGNSLTNTPTLINNYSIPGTNPIDVDLIRDCDDFYMITCSYGSSDLVISQMGSDLSNSNPIHGTPIPNAPLGLAVRFIRNGGTFYSLSTAGNGQLTVQRLGDDLSAPSPFITGTFSVGSSATDIALHYQNSQWNGLIPLENGSALVGISFVEDCFASSPTATDSIPAGITFTTPDTIPISLTATDSNGGISSTFQDIVIKESPITSFTWSGNCLGSNTVFQNNSSITSSALTGFNWQFGDGGTSTLQHPSHLYADTGNYTVTLICSAGNGCSTSFDTVLRIAPVPTSQFTIGNACSETPLSIIDLSAISSGSITSWLWYFGNGDTSTDAVPLYAYPGGGTFDVSLKVVSDAGCADSSSYQVNIQDRPVGALDVSNTCVGQAVQFLDLSTIANATITDRTWYFGDGDSSTVSNPTHTYSGGSANYPLLLLVTASNGCIDTVEFDLRISEIPTSDFSFSPTTICTGMELQFTDLSSVTGDTISAWQWEFGDNSTDSINSPSHVYQQAGTYSVNLVAYSPTNCPGNIRNIQVNVLQGPTADFLAYDACIGNPMSFLDLSVAPPGSTITGYSWNFGNGDTSTLQNPNLTYIASGSYAVVQTISTDQGCIASDTETVYVRELPVAGFTTDLPCNGQFVNFTNTTTTDQASSLLNNFWNFGDFGSGASNTSNQFEPTHLFSGQLTYDVSLIAETNFGCRDTFSSEITVLPASPVQFTYSPTCYGDLMEFFNPGSPLDSTYLWDFGDNQFNQLQEPAHFYAFPGNYTVKLQVTAASGCVTSATRTVTVSPIPNAQFITAPACSGTPFAFENTSSIGSGSITDYSWSLNGTNFSNQEEPELLFPDTGLFTIALIVTSDIGCQDSYTASIRNHPTPNASFSFNPQYGNPPLAVTFTDLSVGGITYEWDFGDGSPTATGPSPVHVYQDTGYFDIREIVTSAFGCKDTLLKDIYVIRPVLDIAVLDDSSYRIGDYFYVVARIANLGTRPIDSVLMEARLDQGSTIREKYIQLIPNGPEGLDVYYFSASFYLPDPGAPRFYCIKADAPNGERDDVPSNNERCFNRTPDLQINVYPNPFKEGVTIDLILPYFERIEIGLYDMQGRLVRQYYSGDAPPGLLRLSDSYPSLEAGTYALKVLYRNRIENRLIIKR